MKGKFSGKGFIYCARVKPYPGGRLACTLAGGEGKFTYPCYLLKYLSKRHQTWQFYSTSDKDKKYIHDILIFVMTSSYFIDDVIKISVFEGQQ